jgi:methionyl-tRNA synthetase
MDTAMASWKFHEAAGAFNALVSFGDQYINLTKPWEGGEGSESAIFNAVVILDNAASLLAPFLPTTAAAITAAIQWTGDDTLVVSKVPPLFPNLP